MTYQLAVFGNPIAHSLSPQIHEQFATQAGIDICYEKTLVTEEDFVATAERFFASGGKGLNVTVPHKHSAFKLAAVCSPEATKAEAVNTLLLAETGQIRGENTDGRGLLNDLTLNLGWSLKDKRILILGAGGAVQGVISDLLSASPADLVIANRTLAKAEDIVAKHQSNSLSAIPLEGLLDCDPFDVIISGSSAGLQGGGQGANLPDDLKHGATCCYDMIYGKPTDFLKWAEDLATEQVADGLGMLVEQAARSFQLWFGATIETAPVLKHMRAQILNA